MQSGPAQRKGKVTFGPFQFDLESGELWRQGTRIKLSPKPAQALAVLIAAEGQLVTRDAIRNALWSSDTHLDFEHALNFCIREIRAALGDTATSPQYVETFARRGYRFRPPVRISIRSTTQAFAEPDAAGESQQLNAYRHYDNGRKSLAKGGKEALEMARDEFARAIELRPDYALAHSGLAAACVLSNLNRRHPGDLEDAEFHLTRALALDPELAEPYPWLCMVLMRKGRYEAAIQAGLRGVQLQPDLVTAHYFLGLAYFAGAETDARRYHDAARNLLVAARVEPHWQATWFVLAYLALLTGHYSYAETYAGRLLEMSASPKGIPFIGAEIIQGSVALRRGDPAAARRVLLAFLDRVAELDHMYRDTMSAAAACILGDVELRHGDPAAALAQYRKAWHTVQEYPRIAAYLRIAARAQAGLSSAYFATGAPDRGRELLETALQMASDAEPGQHNSAAASMPEVYWTIASACMRLGDSAGAVQALQNAVRTGWRDAAWMENDPELHSLRRNADLDRLIEEIRAWPVVSFQESS